MDSISQLVLLSPSIPSSLPLALLPPSLSLLYLPLSRSFTSHLSCSDVPSSLTTHAWLVSVYPQSSCLFHIKIDVSLTRYRYCSCSLLCYLWTFCSHRSFAVSCRSFLVPDSAVLSWQIASKIIFPSPSILEPRNLPPLTSSRPICCNQA